jgi:hypothetical protein
MHPEENCAIFKSFMRLQIEWGIDINKKTNQINHHFLGFFLKPLMHQSTISGMIINIADPKIMPAAMLRPATYGVMFDNLCMNTNTNNGVIDTIIDAVINI